MFKPVSDQHDFIKMEKKWLKHWYEQGIVKKYLLKNQHSSQRFSFMDGPITANNPMGVHHAWGRSYKDLWQKFYNLLGFKQRFQNGFDCQGLWVEVEVEKELNLKTKKEIENLVPGDKKASIAKFVQLCKARVKKFSQIQETQSKRLGYFMDWENSYFTMSPENNYMIWYFLKVCWENGWIYKGEESVPWCPRCETAISQHEMLTEDYKAVVHESIYLRLKLLQKKNEYLLIWTTTPWTIPANIAVAVDKNIDYALVKEKEESFCWVAKDLVKVVFAKRQHKIIRVVKGSQLVGLRYTAPFDDLPAVKTIASQYPDKMHLVIATDDKILPISLNEGTGLVHTAVGAGAEDFKLGKKYGLPILAVIGDNADYLEGFGFLTGKNAKKNPRLILDYLIQKDKEGENFVFGIVNYKHRYPACWRCKKELVWKVAEEWYIAMDKKCKKTSPYWEKYQNKTLRECMITTAKKIKWMPEFGLERELDWLKNMHDWLISKKNRYWGLALPIYECKKCHHFEVIGSQEELKQRSVRGWNNFAGHTPHKPFIDEVVIKCSFCQAEVKRIEDVGNPWLDAGIVPFSTLIDPKTKKISYLSDKQYFSQWFPQDFITESFPGQFKNWFYAMIAMATVLENTNPFERVLGYGTCLGEDGRPMHKSWGNYIPFDEGADKIGVDVMRLLFAKQNPKENLLFGYKKADEMRRQFYLILWNTYKFFVEYANLEKPLVGKERKKSLNLLDEWIWQRFLQTTNIMKTSFSRYDALTATEAAMVLVNDLSTWYIRRSRDRLWVNSDDQADKQSFYNTLYFILVNLMIVLSPVLPFITEEIYTNLTRKESVHLAYWPDFSAYQINKKLIKDMQLIREIVEVGHRLRKINKVKIRQPLATAVIFLPQNKVWQIKKNQSQYAALIAGELNIKQIDFQFHQINEIKIEIDWQLTTPLIREGKLRDLIRLIQEKRKQLKAKITDKIDLTIPHEFTSDALFLKKRVLARKIDFGPELKVKLC